MLIRTSGFAGEDRQTEWHTQFPWEGIELIQGGSKGIVLRSEEKGGNYRTAFVEVFGEECGFIRGEGATIPEAEAAAWAKYTKAMGCPGHEYEPRGYTNGGGFCKHCKRFEGKAFTAQELGQFCRECGTPTYEQDYLGFACNDHISGHQYLARIRELENDSSIEADDETWELWRKFFAAQSGKDVDNSPEQ